MADVIMSVAGTYATEKDLVEYSSPANTVVVTGDSWAAGEIAADGVSSASKGIFRNTNAFLGNYFEPVNIAGVGGEPIAGMKARFSSAVIAYNPVYWFYIGGINSVKGNISAADMFADMKFMIDLAISNGITPIILPCQASEGGFTVDAVNETEVRLRIDQWGFYNRKLLTYAMQKSGWIYASTAYQGIIDQEFYDTTYATVYEPAITAAYQLDGAHIAQAGALRAGKDIASQLSSIFQSVDMLPRHDNDYGKGVNNPMQKVTGTPWLAQADGAGFTGPAAEGWLGQIIGAGTGAVVGTQVARTDVEGAYWARNTAVNMQDGQVFNYSEKKTGGAGFDFHLLADADLAIGDVVEFYAEININSVSDGAGGSGDLNQVNMAVRLTTAAHVTVEYIYANRNSGSTTPSYVDSDLTDAIRVIATARYTIPATVAEWSISFNAQILAGAAGDTDFIFDVGRVGVRKIA